jgi:hypothetical protein
LGERIVGGPGNTHKVRLGRSVFTPTPELFVLQIKLTKGKTIALIVSLSSSRYLPPSACCWPSSRLREKRNTHSNTVTTMPQMKLVKGQPLSQIAFLIVVAFLVTLCLLFAVVEVEGKALSNERHHLNPTSASTNLQSL